MQCITVHDVSVLPLLTLQNYASCLTLHYYFILMLHFSAPLPY